MITTCQESGGHLGTEGSPVVSRFPASAEVQELSGGQRRPFPPARRRGVPAVHLGSRPRYRQKLEEGGVALPPSKMQRRALKGAGPVGTRGTPTSDLARAAEPCEPPPPSRPGRALPFGGSHQQPLSGRGRGPHRRLRTAVLLRLDAMV